MLEYDHHKQKLMDKSPLLFRRSDFTALYSERGLIFVIEGYDAKSFYTACEKYDIQNDTWRRIANLNVAIVETPRLHVHFQQKLSYVNLRFLWLLIGPEPKYI